MNAIFSQEQTRLCNGCNLKGKESADTIEAAEQLKIAAERFLILARTPRGLEI